MVTICFDYRLANQSGMGRFISLGIAPALLKIVDIKLVIICSELEHESVKKLMGDKAEILLCDIPPYSLKEQLWFYKELPNYDLFISGHVNVPWFRKERSISIIYDVFHVTRHNKGPFLTKMSMYLYILLCVLKSKCIITISKFSKREIYRKFRTKKPVIVPLGTNLSEQLETYPVLNPPITKPFLLLVGNCKPHKNFEVVADALSLLDRNVNVVVAGKRDGFRTGMSLEMVKKTKEFIYLGRIPDSELVWLYKNASCLVFPSIYEGFGLPPIEAGSFECPVIVSDIPVCREVCGDAVTYFNPNDASELASKIDFILKNKTICLQDVAKFKNHIERFSWQNCEIAIREILYLNGVGSNN